jgi:hypothetical protein
MDDVQVIAAGNAILDACYASDDPVTTFKAILDRLWATEEWVGSGTYSVAIVGIESVKAKVNRNVP